MHKRLTSVFMVLVCCFASASLLATEPLTVTSPDGSIAITFELKSQPQPYLPVARAYNRVS